MLLFVSDRSIQSGVFSWFCGGRGRCCACRAARLPSLPHPRCHTWRPLPLLLAVCSSVTVTPPLRVVAWRPPRFCCIVSCPQCHPPWEPSCPCVGTAISPSHPGSQHCPRCLLFPHLLVTSWPQPRARMSSPSLARRTRTFTPLSPAAGQGPMADACQALTRSNCLFPVGHRPLVPGG